LIKRTEINKSDFVHSLSLSFAIALLNQSICILTQSRRRTWNNYTQNAKM